MTQGSNFPPPPPQPQMDTPSQPGYSQLPLEAVKKKVGPPAVALIITAAVGLCMQIIGLLTRLVSSQDPEVVMKQMNEAFSQMGWDINPEMYEPLFNQQGVYGIISSVFGLIMVGIVFYGGLKMKKLENWGLSLAASILAIVPCLSPCCCIGMPIGIWALIVLLDDHVKDGFKQNTQFK
ncbi:MAG: hypothetical protein CSA81_10835 [Acidobacteria bacterium]|nr:MAG: hypothetical protein CSA81_10835 [Acidobacteriota bacterium]